MHNQGSKYGWLDFNEILRNIKRIFMKVWKKNISRTEIIKIHKNVEINFKK